MLLSGCSKLQLPNKHKSPAKMRTQVRQFGTLTPTVSLEGLRDLLEVLGPELEAAGGLTLLWARELQRDLEMLEG